MLALLSLQALLVLLYLLYMYIMSHYYNSMLDHMLSLSMLWFH